MGIPDRSLFSILTVFWYVATIAARAAGVVASARAVWTDAGR